ncbi:hypothetical protein GCM10011490_24540 [Pseudoclavibacter endophyticus]|uniref:DNA-binding protein n=1 Tax=Pseudoclavibacter endophyticus TaxID=1778590 RepID=A0A6H9WP27_9MICO|nr:DNA-binding protein [Pseudoclavibacter endophyticus]KAB1647791.1 DNA-binding protein [Pseudoclavibacter endophyticus]GGA72848.1 hypothetical protein GCM10011490_24540 [Pseudoclavibacter endophyticus]
MTTSVRTGRSETLPQYLSPAQVCERIPGMTLRKLADHREKGTGPVWVEIDARTKAYDWADVVAWLEKRKRSQTDRFARRP